MPPRLPAAISRCLDQEEELQELFLGSAVAPPVLSVTPVAPEATWAAAPEAAEAAPELSVDTGRIEIERADSDGLREALMST